MAALATEAGDAVRAARVKGAEMALREHLGIPLPPVDRPGSEEALTRLRAVLGDEGFTRAWEGGRTMSLGEAIAYTLDEPA